MSNNYFDINLHTSYLRGTYTQSHVVTIVEFRINLIQRGKQLNFLE